MALCRVLAEDGQGRPAVRLPGELLPQEFPGKKHLPRRFLVQVSGVYDEPALNLLRGAGLRPSPAADDIREWVAASDFTTAEGIGVLRYLEGCDPARCRSRAQSDGSGAATGARGDRSHYKRRCRNIATADSCFASIGPVPRCRSAVRSVVVAVEQSEETGDWTTLCDWEVVQRLNALMVNIGALRKQCTPPAETAAVKGALSPQRVDVVGRHRGCARRVVLGLDRLAAGRAALPSESARAGGAVCGCGDAGRSRRDTNARRACVVQRGEDFAGEAIIAHGRNGPFDSPFVARMADSLPLHAANPCVIY